MSRIESSFLTALMCLEAWLQSALILPMSEFICMAILRKKVYLSTSFLCMYYSALEFCSCFRTPLSWILYKQNLKTISTQKSL